ncbi:hypothetical protein A3F34_01680 [Candidatus Roizmanbacteria bacterium RIFCSPHIGHO2_12_FULL_44_10]|uniref:Peptide chain release factor domain-containing protein n=1 Tax=Candidatus Roizmanbacteria bacterium RIFCSPHIGHO2_12_FULL_44_10 TaxID=1802054 RepID=A0A1F7IB25_9BACT|nr:MAG: hypothetical protein A3F34_01680 [Candidatus Roizmanbacteria bacterium RIFCSPHIGHO2_12_FULL_44_10]
MDEQKEALSKRLKVLLEKVNIENLKKESQDLEKETYGENFWQDHEKAGDVSKRISDIKKQIDDLEMMQLLLEENQLVELEKLLREYEILIFLWGNLILTMPLSAFMPVRAVQKRWIGPQCCTACIPDFLSERISSGK